ncbi:hypothetical protein ROSMUCSMR3_03532 [Roseovarius mucosus]|uniref:Uncharacterized protein n=1 Tax=Roseovarius mucosus TaxID=215743 RepID=A0A1V0RTG6_9RHOB|nr:hypothetical protein ROSMUCSMR3_03532 [Roseovarius mucosus]
MSSHSTSSGAGCGKRVVPTLLQINSRSEAKRATGMSISGCPSNMSCVIHSFSKGSLRRFVGSDDGRARAGGVSSLVRATGGAA